MFVHGCFWHGCSQHGTWPKANAVWWRDKIEANIRRDQDTTARLSSDGWLVLQIWEHDDPEFAADQIERAVKKRSESKAV